MLPTCSYLWTEPGKLFPPDSGLYAKLRYAAKLIYLRVTRVSPNVKQSVAFMKKYTWSSSQWSINLMRNIYSNSLRTLMTEAKWSSEVGGIFKQAVRMSWMVVWRSLSSAVMALWFTEQDTCTNKVMSYRKNCIWLNVCNGTNKEMCSSDSKQPVLFYNVKIKYRTIILCNLNRYWNKTHLTSTLK